MVALSEHDRQIIARHPLGDSLGHLAKSLQDADEACVSISDPRNDDDTSEQDRQDVISRLLTTLMGTKGAFRLLSKSGGQDVASDLAFLFARIRKDDFNYSYYHPLVRLILQRAPDSDIWSAVFDLIATLARVTPPASAPASFDSTPISHSSASQQGAEQTREVVEPRIFDEIKFCTYRDVQGFFKKYFEGKDWTQRALDVYYAIKDRHVNGEWIDFPDPPVQAEVLDWWNRFQDDLLSEEGRRYYSTTKPTDLVGAEAKRQIDLFIKRKGLPAAVHDWTDVEVLGELKVSDNKVKGPLLQLGRYVRDVFSRQPTRRFVHAFTISGRKMEVWVFDRSGCYSPGPFDIHQEPQRFIQVIAGYTMMNEEELGLDTFTERDDDSCFIHIEQDVASAGKRLQLESEPFTHQRAIVCRGTSCYRTKPLDSEGWSYVTKWSWTSDKRKPEVDLLTLAGRRGVEGIAKLIGHRRITSINEMRSGLTFTKPYSFRGASAASSLSQSFPKSQRTSAVSHSFRELHGLSLADVPSRKRKSSDVGLKPSKRSRSNSQRSAQGHNEVTYDVEEAQGTSLLAPGNGPYDNRVFRCLVISPAGRAIHQYEKTSELLEALRDAIKAHKSLYLKGKILHRDISENNIIITNGKTTGHMGMLIDLDLAKERDSGPSGARCRTGTMEFMAIEVLLGTDHTYRHDLESFFYVLIWQCARRGWELLNDPRDYFKSKLRYWYAGDYEDIANTKLGHMNKADDKGFGLVLREFPPEFECVKPLCRELREILFPICQGELFTGTPKDPEVLYGPIINAFNRAINDIKATEV